jgi:hypothetical protein
MDAARAEQDALAADLDAAVSGGADEPGNGSSHVPEEARRDDAPPADARESSHRLAALLDGERAGFADFLVALAGFDRDRLWLQLGHPSLFSYLSRELGLSNASAYYRKVAAELIQRFPEVVEPLRDGRLCITSVVALARVITGENRAEVLPRFFHKSKRQARAVAVEIRPAEVVPRREVRTSFRPDEVDTTHPEEGNPSSPATASSPAIESSPATASSTAAPSSPPPSSTEPLTAELCRLHLTVSKQFLSKLDRARAGQSHVQRGASAAEVMEAALDLLLQLQARRRGAVAKPQARPRPSGAGHVPVSVRRAVWERDGGRCQWPVDSGGTCDSTHQVELDHVVPRARGGPSTADNCRLLCRVHNDLAARQAFGNNWMDQFTGGDPRRAAGTSSSSWTSS